MPDEVSTDGGPEFTTFATQQFFTTWGVKHRVSSAYFPQLNGRAKVAVKVAKRLLMSNISPSGDLNNDSFLQALLQLLQQVSLLWIQTKTFRLARFQPLCIQTEKPFVTREKARQYRSLIKCHVCFRRS